MAVIAKKIRSTMGKSISATVPRSEDSESISFSDFTAPKYPLAAMASASTIGP